MICLYHSSDLDGHCSGAIVKKRFPECKMIGINHGQHFDIKSLLNEIVYIVDFSFPIKDMIEIFNITKKLVWIDHHISSIKEADYLGFNPEGSRIDGVAACALTWMYLYPSDMLPIAVKHLANYDVWDLEDPVTIYFQYGFRLFGDTVPENQSLWDKFLVPFNKHIDPDKDIDLLISLSEIQKVVNKGKIIYPYECKINEKYVSNYSFLINDFHGYRAMCVNKGMTNSLLFDSTDKDEYDIMITFCMTPDREWVVSLYSEKDYVDCSEVAKKYGGGGHKGASGFKCPVLPYQFFMDMNDVDDDL